MPIPEEILNQIKCCLSSDGHIALEPIPVNCGATACNECIKNSNQELIDCLCCKGQHDKKSLINQPVQKAIESIVSYFLNDLLDYAKENFENMSLLLKEEALVNELNSKIETIENEMDIRVESLVSSIHDYREECKKKFNVFRDKYIQNIFKIFRRIQLETKKLIPKIWKNGNRSALEAIKEIQIELKSYQLKLNGFIKFGYNSLIIYYNWNYSYSIKLKFIASKFEFSKESFGEVKEYRCWLNDSLILTNEECLSIVEMTKSAKENLLYRASRDGFSSHVFHAKCDGKGNTITIIKNNLNCVFGGFASYAWNSSGLYTIDANAFIFSLRRCGVSFQDKFNCKNTGHAFKGCPNAGPIFGGNAYRPSRCDIHICNQSNETIGSYCNFGYSYELPEGYEFGEDNAKGFLAGRHDGWTTTEIEVYQVI